MPAPRLMQKSRLAIADIDASNRLRPVSEAGVESLLASIADLGVMKDPVHVRQKKNGKLILIAGGHRLEAARRLGWTEIDAQVWTDVTDDWARLMEIDDNLAGAEMNALDNAVFLAERKRVYEKLHPETKAAIGAELVSKRWNTADMMSVVSFATVTAEKFGITDRHVRRMVAAGENLAAHEVQRLRGAARPVSMADLQTIGTLGPAERYAVVDALVAGTAKSAAKALAAHKSSFGAAGSNVVSLEAERDTGFRVLMDAWKRADPAARRRFASEVGSDVIAMMNRQGAAAK